MLRPPPTSIPLTRGEVAQYEIRKEARRQTRLRSASHTSTHGPSYGSTLGHAVIRKGPQRSVIYLSTPSASSASSEIDTSDATDNAGSLHHSRDWQAQLHPSSDGTILETTPTPPNRFRRDSVMSYESNGPEVNHTSAVKSARMPIAEDLDQEEASSNSITYDLAFRLRLADYKNAFHQKYGIDHHRGSHARSMSDPSHDESPAGQAGHAPHEGLDGSPPSLHGENYFPNNDELALHGSPDTPRLSAHHSRRHGRHQSAPGSSKDTSPRPTAQSSDQTLDLSYLELGSAMGELLRNRSSPLDMLVHQAQATQRRNGAPARSSDANEVARSRVPFADFRDDEDDDLEAAATRTPSAVRAYVYQDGVHNSSTPPPGHTLTLSTSSLRSSTRAIEALDAQTEGRSWAPGRSMPAEFSLPTSSRRESAGQHHGNRHLIRRRPLPNAEQENEDQMAPFYDERRAIMARQLAAPQGRLEHTPSPEGPLERRLR